MSTKKKVEKKVEKKLLIHRHQYGTSTAVCNCVGFKKNELVNGLSEDQSIELAKLCGLDFEPDKGEELDIVDVTVNFINIKREQIFKKE